MTPPGQSNTRYYNVVIAVDRELTGVEASTIAAAVYAHIDDLDAAIVVSALMPLSARPVDFPTLDAAR